MTARMLLLHLPARHPSSFPEIELSPHLQVRVSLPSLIATALKLTPKPQNLNTPHASGCLVPITSTAATTCGRSAWGLAIGCLHVLVLLLMQLILLLILLLMSSLLLSCIAGLVLPTECGTAGTGACVRTQLPPPHGRDNAGGTAAQCRWWRINRRCCCNHGCSSSRQQQQHDEDARGRQRPGRPGQRCCRGRCCSSCRQRSRQCLAGALPGGVCACCGLCTGLGVPWKWPWLPHTRSGRPAVGRTTQVR